MFGDTKALNPTVSLLMSYLSLILIPARKTIPAVLASGIILLANPLSYAGSATWDLNPRNGDWNTPANWTPTTVPNGVSDTATFGLTNINTVSLSADVEVDSIVFAPGASAYTIASGTGQSRIALNLSGQGIVNNSGAVQNFFVPPFSVLGSVKAGITFTGTAQAGTMTVFTNAPGSGQALNGTYFLDSSSADHATIINQGPTEAPYTGGLTQLEGTSTAGNATIINEPGVHQGGETFIVGVGATGGNATMICNGAFPPTNTGGRIYVGGETLGAATVTVNGSDTVAYGGGFLDLYGYATAGNATLIANGGNKDPGHLRFDPIATGGTARVELFGNGELDLVYPPGNPPLPIGSLEGTGNVLMNSAHLVIGGNGLSTTFSGVLSDYSRQGETPATLEKADAASLTLSGANTYAGGTTVSAGTLIVSNKTGSGTGAGAVAVNGGTLGGSGTLSGAVTVNSGAFLAPAAGTKKQATLTIQSALSFNSGSTYTYTFKAKGKNARADSVVANGVTIASGATFNFSGQAQGKLRQGLTLTVISNTSASAISGTFSNLPDGAILTVGSNNFLASYEGGDGNDLTLTVQ